MSIADGKDHRNFLNIDQAEYMRNKEALRMLKFKVTVFKRQLFQEQRTYKKLLSTQEKRFNTYQPKFKTRKELDAAYLVGAVSDQEYSKQRYAIWLVYSDRGHINNLKWLESELEYYEKKLADFENHLQEQAKTKRQAWLRRQQKRNKHATYMRRTRRAARKKELEERWHRYGIG